MRTATQTTQHITADHALIRQMVEARNGHPAIQVSESNALLVDKLSFYFEARKPVARLWPISWKTFFRIFDAYNEVLSYDATSALADGGWSLVPSAKTKLQPVS